MGGGDVGGAGVSVGGSGVSVGRGVLVGGNGVLVGSGVSVGSMGIVGGGGGAGVCSKRPPRDSTGVPPAESSDRSSRMIVVIPFIRLINSFPTDDGDVSRPYLCRGFLSRPWTSMTGIQTPLHPGFGSRSVGCGPAALETKCVVG